jgi:peptide/nickel transport system substrate-binding protein
VPEWGRPKVDEIIFQAYTNPDTMTQDLLTGTVDAAQGVPSAQFPGLQSNPDLKAISYNFINWDYIDYNSYDSPDSKGNPVLRDPAFRVALDYAIDRDKIVSLVYSGRAAPGYTMITTNTWRDPDFHWEPPAGVKRPFDIAKGNALLDAAGYKDTNGDGIREDKKGRPISLRLWALAESTSTQAEGKLITGWFQQLGLKIVFEVVDNGAASDAMYAWSGNVPSPDYDMILWFWDGYNDPGSTLQCFTTSQIGYWNEVYWSSAEFDRLCAQQGVELDPQKRADLIYRMQQVMYAENPQNVLTYFDYLQAVNVKKWTGWTPYYNAQGPVFYDSLPKSYINIAPRTAAGAASGGGGGASSTGLIVVIAAGVAVVIVAGVMLLRRGSRRRVEEE